MTATQAETDHGLLDAILEMMGKLNVTMGKVEEKIDAETRRKQRLNQNIFPLSSELIGVTTSQNVDLPNVMGPRTGWYWDIHTIIGQGITAGSIAIYKNSSSGVQWGNLTTSGQLNWGKQQFTLTAGERLVFVGSAALPATGAAMSIHGVQVAAPYWGDYAL